MPPGHTAPSNPPHSLAAMLFLPTLLPLLCTPHTSLQVALEVTNDQKAARVVQARLERTNLGQVASSIELVFRPRESWRDGTGYTSHGGHTLLPA